MKKKFKGLFIGSLCLITFGFASLNQGCQKKERDDFIKIESVEYQLKSYHPYLKFKLDSFDNENIKEIVYLLDGKLFVTDFMPYEEVIQERSSTFYARCDELKKGKHTLKAILEDSEGNKLENTYTFEIE